ncbi:MAG: sensor histidine kinase N-terminal domain-containing protein [Candidatus Parcubacteria bacterium]|nr:sensor histidine kinase N-terminal domain-containing protein [Burkholderiales bacterium]
MASSLRGRLLKALLPPIAALLTLGAVAQYFLALEPASEAYDQALVDVGIALGERIRSSGESVAFDLPRAAEQVLRTDKYDTIFYQVGGPDGGTLAGDAGLPAIPGARHSANGVTAYDGEYRGQKVRVVSLLVPCGPGSCRVQVAETTTKRSNLARNIVLYSLVPELLITLATIVIVWFGVKRGLIPLEDLSEEIRARSARDLRPIDPGHAPQEAQPLVGALNQLFGQVAEANDNQRRFLANAAHQLRTPLAGLQAHTEIALAQSPLVRSQLPDAYRKQLEQVHRSTIRTARLANQLLALARAEPGGYHAGPFVPVNLRAVVEDAADEWVHRALAREIDLGFELEPAQASGDALLLREALVNLIHNALEYAAPGGRVTVKTGTRNEAAFLEVEDDGPGIPQPERGRVLERFYRVPGTPGTGSGLGLSIVREIALAHGAGLYIDAGEGAGGANAGCRVGLTFPHG